MAQLIDITQLEQIFIQKLPLLIRQNPQIHELVLELARENFAGRQETQDKFYQILGELRRDREEQARKWEEQNRKWDEYQQEQNRKWEEQNQKWQEQNQEQHQKWQEQHQKWEEQHQKWQEQNQEQHQKWQEQHQKWQEQNQEQHQKWQEQHQEQHQKWEEQHQKWEDAKREFAQMHEAIMAIAQKQERSIGALGARWGIPSENAFRNALAGILAKNFGVEVLNVNEYDEQGEVFGRPDQVEIDVIIKNSLLIVCEIKSSIDKAGMYIFERKVRFYEKKYQRQASRLLVISPMVDPKAHLVADQLGIEVYSDSVDVKSV
jgi:hypothetical protein